MAKQVRIKDRWVGEGHPAYIVAEIGINHNGSVDIAKQLIDAAVRSGCDAVKFQKRTPELCVPHHQRNMIRYTPWGYMTYIEYRHKVELGYPEYNEIDRYCRERGITWFASCWDKPSVDFMKQFDPSCYKIPSACLTNSDLLRYIKVKKEPIILSTGMSTMEQIVAAVELLGTNNIILNHCTSTYPCDPSELNLRMIITLRNYFNCPIGYSGHEVGLATTVAAASLGACLIERHLTLDRSMWGTDQAASVEPQGFERLVRYIRIVEMAMGDGEKKVYSSERSVMERLRLSNTIP